MKKYLEITEKMRMVDDIIDACITDGKLDVVQLEESRVLYITLYYDGDDRFIKDGFGKILGIETYDKLMKNGEFDKHIKRKIPKKEYQLLMTLIEESVKEKLRQSNTVAGIFNHISQLDLEGIMKEFKDLDLDKFKQVSKLIKANNGISEKVK